jgi:hypothetical protein
VLVLRHGPPRRPRLAAPLLRAAPAGAEPLGARRRQLSGECAPGRGVARVEARLRADVPGLPGPDERAARGPYPDLTDAELRTGLDLMPSRVAATSTGR